MSRFVGMYDNLGEVSINITVPTRTKASTRMLELKCNFKNKYSKKDFQCPLKCNLEDSQKHLLLCEKLELNQITKQLPQHEDLLSVLCE